MKLTLFILLVFSFNLIQTIGAFAGTMLAMPVCDFAVGSGASQADIDGSWNLKLYLSRVELP